MFNQCLESHNIYNNDKTNLYYSPIIIIILYQTFLIIKTNN